MEKDILVFDNSFDLNRQIELFYAARCREIEKKLGVLSLDPYYDFKLLLEASPECVADTPEDSDNMRALKAAIRDWLERYNDWLSVREATVADASDAGADYYGE